MGTNYKHLSCEERTLIKLSLKQGCTPRVIVRRLQWAPSSISRELKRSGWTDPITRPRNRGCPTLADGHRVPLAKQRATGLARTARYPSRLAQDGPLWGYGARLLRDRYSPEQISGILCRMQPDDPMLQVRYETIYTAIYAMPRGELRTALIACLRHGHKSRRPRARRAYRRGTIPNMVSSHMRPPEIEDRVMPSHWEGDLIKGARNASAIGTLVERSTLFVALVKMDHATAAAAVTRLGTVLNHINPQRGLSLTYDRGREMAEHKRLAEMTGIKVYFADPHSPWQHGINESINGLLRRYFPKQTDHFDFTQVELDAVAEQLNIRPCYLSAGSALQTCLCLTPLTFFSIIVNSLHFNLETA